MGAGRSLKRMGRLIGAAGLLGLVVGLLSLGLGAAVDGAAALFAAQPGLGWAMPVAGFAAFGLYRLLRVDFSWSTARVVKAAREGEEVPLRLAFAIIAGTALTILGGGSVGKEAAALQMGVAASGPLRRLAAPAQRRLLAPAAMAAALGALLDAPLAGIVFSFEVMRKRPAGSAEVACPAVAALVAWGVARMGGARLLPGSFPKAALVVPDEVLPALGLAVAVGLAAAAMARVFCGALHGLRCGLARLGAPLFALAVGGAATSLGLGYAEVFGYEGLRAYCGTGAAQIAAALAGDAPWWGFVAKAALTLLTLAGGYKGGEIMPVLAVGACLGAAVGEGACALAAMGGAAVPCSSGLAVSGALPAILGFSAFFAACAKCPLAAGVMAAELFGPEAAAVSVPAIALAYLCSGQRGLYPTAIALRDDCGARRGVLG